jgi:16S rRNA (guanine527-N7)-methyltransferase
MLRPHVDLTLIEASRRKAAALEVLAGELGLDVRVDARPAEEAGRDPSMREQFDAVSARGVGRVDVALELSRPLVRRDGALLLTTGLPPPHEQLENAMRELGLSMGSVHELGRGRGVLELRASGTLADRYPRRTGVPRRAPIGGQELL